MPPSSASATLNYGGKIELPFIIWWNSSGPPSHTVYSQVRALHSPEQYQYSRWSRIEWITDIESFRIDKGKINEDIRLHGQWRGRWCLLDFTDNQANPILGALAVQRAMRTHSFEEMPGALWIERWLPLFPIMTTTVQSTTHTTSQNYISIFKKK